MRLLILSCVIILLSGCAQQYGRYSQKYDSAPKVIPPHDPAVVEPVFVEYNPANSRPYTLFGQYFTPLETGLGFEEQGEASWYGQKFHGHLTANGEIYDMYEFTAAHKTLPLPSFVKVTNLHNKRELVVRVNDRGPFHNDRILDLSFAAARELDVIKTGTANVKIEVIHVAENGAMHIGKTPYPLPAMPGDDATDPQNHFIQVAALQDFEKVDELARGLTVLYQVPAITPKQDGMYRLRLGPFVDKTVSDKLLQELKSNGFNSAYRVYAP